ncbi:MAG: argininosuccinate synthase [Candidatus Carbobacillus altaicus]|nr:argininosuccinate synthase [Candidatus Carbobacillus altaicus]
MKKSLLPKTARFPIPVDLDNPFSIDANIWGRACEAGVLEDHLDGTAGEGA